MSNPRKPKEQKVIEGTFRKDRDVANTPEAEPLTTTPKPPASMPKEAQVIWKSLCAVLIPRNVLTDMDLMALEILCINIWMYRECMATIKAETAKKYIKSRNSQTALALTSMNKAALIIKSYAGLFGLTPSDRARLNLGGNKAPSTDPMEQLLRAK